MALTEYMYASNALRTCTGSIFSRAFRFFFVKCFTAIFKELFFKLVDGKDLCYVVECVFPRYEQTRLWMEACPHEMQRGAESMLPSSPNRAV